MQMAEGPPPLITSTTEEQQTMYKRILKVMGSPSASPRNANGSGMGAPAAGTDGATKGEKVAKGGARTAKQGKVTKAGESSSGEAPPTIIHMTAAPAEALPISEQILTATPRGASLSQKDHQLDMGQIAAAIVQRVSSHGDHQAGPATNTGARPANSTSPEGPPTLTVGQPNEVPPP